MKKDNIIRYRVWGRRALFSDPINRVGGEKFSYQIPTYQALVGVTESIYWKPTFKWKILSCHVINPIQTITQAVKPLPMSKGKESELSYYTYLKDVEYIVEAKMEWNENREDLRHDRNENKHYFMAKRALDKGGRRDIFLGTRECQAYVEPYDDDLESSYKDINEMSFGLQFHSFIYPDQAIRKEEENYLTSLFWHSQMNKGIIKFPDQQECTIRKRVRSMNKKEFIEGHNFTTIDNMEVCYDMDE